MSTTQIIDDLFLDSSYQAWLDFYFPLYGEKVRKPLTINGLTRVVAKYLGKEVKETHLFYLPDRPSFFLREHLTSLARDFVKGKEGLPPESEELPVSDIYLIDYVRDQFETGAEELLERSDEALFHPCDFVAIDASRFAAECDNAVLFADDPIYGNAQSDQELIFIRTGGEDTRMPPEVPWINVDHIYCMAYGVS